MRIVNPLKRFRQYLGRGRQGQRPAKLRSRPRVEELEDDWLSIRRAIRQAIANLPSVEDLLPTEVDWLRRVALQQFFEAFRRKAYLEDRKILDELIFEELGTPIETKP
jgi:hypothetical protein